MKHPKGRAVPVEDNRAPGIYTSSLYGARADMPLVELELHGYAEPRVQMTVEQARAVAIQILETCEAATSDAFVVRFFRDHIGVEESEVGPLLTSFRDMRETLDRPKADAPKTA